MIGVSLLFFFNDTATTEIYTLSLHDALPISRPQGLDPRNTLTRTGPCAAAQGAGRRVGHAVDGATARLRPRHLAAGVLADRKSTRLNSSHANISYAVFCLKKKKNITLLIMPT